MPESITPSRLVVLFPPVIAIEDDSADIFGTAPLEAPVHVAGWTDAVAMAP